MSAPDTSIIKDEKKVAINAMYIEFAAGTDVVDAMAEMWRLHMSKQVDVETVFNDVRIVVADNAMLERFGYKPLRKLKP